MFLILDQIHFIKKTLYRCFKNMPYFIIKIKLTF